MIEFKSSQLFRIVIIPFLIITIVACSKRQVSNIPTPPVTLEEAFLTPRDETDNIDSPAIWHGPNNEHWLITTAKKTHRLLIYDGATGSLIKKFGQPGSAPGEFKRPNGIAVVGNLMMVVERDNRRVQIFSLPDLKSLGTVGEDQLKRPYGIAVFSENATDYSLFITDNYETANEQIPPEDQLNQRVKQWQLRIKGDQVESNFIQAFGNTSGPGMLKKVESIYADTFYKRLLIADELASENCIKIYNLDGKFTGKLLGKGIFTSEPEGIALYKCDNTGSGFWITTDQSHRNNTFYIFDRRTLKLIGAFTGKQTANTDGIALTQNSFGEFPTGAFFAVHNDGNVSAIPLDDIVNNLWQPLNCY